MCDVVRLTRQREPTGTSRGPMGGPRLRLGRDDYVQLCEPLIVTVWV